MDCDVEGSELGSEDPEVDSEDLLPLVHSDDKVSDDKVSEPDAEHSELDEGMFGGEGAGGPASMAKLSAKKQGQCKTWDLDEDESDPDNDCECDPEKDGLHTVERFESRSRSRGRASSPSVARSSPSPGAARRPAQGPLATEVAPPPFLEGCEHWQQILWDGISGLRARLPQEPSRAMNSEHLCAGTLGEVFGMRAMGVKLNVLGVLVG